MIPSVTSSIDLLIEEMTNRDMARLLQTVTKAPGLREVLGNEHVIRLHWPRALA
jgi:hypothetical protein